MTVILWILDNFLSLILLLPIRNERGRYRSFPFTTVGLIVVNSLVFVGVNLLLPGWIGDEETYWILTLPMKLLPAAIIEGVGLGAVSIVTSAFMHGGWFHLIGNMYYLFFFGRKLEDVLGPAQFLLFYLSCAFISGIVSILGWTALPLTQGKIPGLGASGAIMGIVGAYLFLYHEQRIRTLVMLFGVIPIPYALPMPAWVFILYTIVGDFARGWLQREAESLGLIYSLVDSFAHLGGVVAGLTCLYFFLPRELLYYRHRINER